VCAEKLTSYPFYFAHHKNCTLNTTCSGSFFKCSTLCPEPTDYDKDNGVECSGDDALNTWKGCQGSGCAVCIEQIATYPNYLKNHPDCTVHESCDGLLINCGAPCPAPTSADQ
jgi:hypothetical protein